MDRMIAQSLPGMNGRDERYKHLHKLDMIVNAEFYDHLPYGFYQETDMLGNKIPLYQRRPSSPFNLCATAARKCANKLFAGRHAPRIGHKDPGVQQKILALFNEARLGELMVDAALRGSVGSVAVTFKVLTAANGEAKVVTTLFNSKDCVPTFDHLNELSSLRVQFLSTGYALMGMGHGFDSNSKPIQPALNYWFVKDFTRTEEIAYYPLVDGSWTPHDPDKSKLKKIEDDRFSYKHDLGFVPAHWFKNPGVGKAPWDGDCWWRLAIPLNVELDYDVSALGRGIRYNSSPQVVINGMLMMPGGNAMASTGGGNGMGMLPFLAGDVSTIQRGPTSVWQFPPTKQDGEGNRIEGGGASLLEMTGQGIKVGLEFIQLLRTFGLEMILASQKNPENLSGAMSGRAMEDLDDDYASALESLRTAWGEYGVLVLIKKICMAAIHAKHQLVRGLTEEAVDAITLDWPQLFKPTPEEVKAMCEAMVLVTGTPDTPGTPASGDKPATPDIPGTPALVEPELASAYLKANIEFPEVSANKVDPITTTKGKGKRKPGVAEERPAPKPEGKKGRPTA